MAGTTFTERPQDMNGRVLVSAANLAAVFLPAVLAVPASTGCHSSSNGPEPTVQV